MKNDFELAAKNFQNITVQEIMSTDIISALESWTVKYLTDFFVDKQISGAPVINSEEKLVGVVTITDLLKADSTSADNTIIDITSDHLSELSRNKISEDDVKQLNSQANSFFTVGSIMTREVIQVSPEDNLISAAAIMLENDIHRLFVTNNSIVSGVITTMDLIKPLAARSHFN